MFHLYVLSNTRIFENLNTGCPALGYDTDYLVLIHFTPSFGIEVSLATDVEGRNKVFTYNVGVAEHDYASYTQVSRNTFYIDAAQARSNSKMTGSIIGIAASSKIKTWGVSEV